MKEFCAVISCLRKRHDRACPSAPVQCHFVIYVISLLDQTTKVICHVSSFIYSFIAPCQFSFVLHFQLLHSECSIRHILPEQQTGSLTRPRVLSLLNFTIDDNLREDHANEGKIQKEGSSHLFRKFEGRS